MGGQRCILCGQIIKGNQAVIRGIVEVVEPESVTEEDVALREKIHDWNMVFAYHLSCVVEADNYFFGEKFCNEIDVGACQQELKDKLPALVCVK